MFIIEQWAKRHGVSGQALQELRTLMLAGLADDYTPQRPRVMKSEADVSNAVRIEASCKGAKLWRNNVGVLMDKNGRPVRYGLANDSKEVNRVIKSADLIGIKPVLITPQMVGCTIGQFVSREAKTPGWSFTGSERESAQLTWAKIIIAMGGDAAFCNDVGTL